MKSFWTTSFVAALIFACCPNLAQAWTILWSDDFETNTNSRQSASHVTMTQVNNPSGLGQALLFSDTGHAGTWGAELSANSGLNASRVFTLADYGAVAGKDRIIFKFDLFIPNDSVTVGDYFGPFVRYVTDAGNDGGTASGGSTSVGLDTRSKGSWHSIEQEFLIPATAKNNQTGGEGNSPTTRIAAFMSFNDGGAANLVGELFYLDNIQVVLTPEPSKMLLFSIGAGALFLRRKRHA